jgi:hypothetical protein
MRITSNGWLEQELGPDERSPNSTYCRWNDFTSSLDPHDGNIYAKFSA